jgi:hypothetical protein
MKLIYQEGVDSGTILFIDQIASISRIYDNNRFIITMSSGDKYSFRVKGHHPFPEEIVLENFDELKYLEMRRSSIVERIKSLS